MVFVALSFSIKAYVADCIAVQIYRMKICQAGERSDVTDLVIGKREGNQVRKTGQRGEIAHLIRVQVHLFQFCQTGQGTYITHLILEQFEPGQIRKIRERA